MAEPREENWKSYSTARENEARPYVPGESLTGISVQPNYEPKAGDMICRNPKNRDDMWLISKDYFDQNYREL